MTKVRKGRQFHNQPEDSHQHRYLVALWDEVRNKSGGLLDIAVHASNAGVAGSDPAVLDMIVSGELEFATLMGPLLAARVPAAEIQGLPFAFADSEQAHVAVDGTLGEYLRREASASNIALIPGGALENGFRQICSVKKTVRGVEDLAGYRMRVPAGRILSELFDALGAVPVTVNIAGLSRALETGEVDGHENPLAIVEVNRLHDLTRHIALTNHVWSAFNLIAHLPFWESLDDSLREIVQRAVRTQVAVQRADTVALNRALEANLASRGIAVERIDIAPFRARLAGAFYARARERCGRDAWTQLEASVGRLPV